MHDDQENYDTFEYDQSDGDMYEPLTDVATIPKNAPPLPPARRKNKQDMQRKPLPPPKYFTDFKTGSLPKVNQVPTVPDCDENYEEFPCHITDFKTGSLPKVNQVPTVPDCDENYEEFPCHITDYPAEENYECFESYVDNNPPSKMKPPLPDRKLSTEKPKCETKPLAIASRFKHTDTTKIQEKPLSSPKPSFLSEINSRMKNFTLPGKDSSPTMNLNKSVGSEPTSKAPKRGSFESQAIPLTKVQPIQTEQDDTDDEDSREVYADACDVRLFLQNKPWYFGKLGRKAEESLLNDIKQNGTFLLRDSSQASLTHPFTLTVYSNNHFYRLKIRHLESGKFVVGEKKESEIEFNTVPDLITYYKTEPLLLLATTDNSNSCTTLKYIPEKNKGNLL